MDMKAEPSIRLAIAGLGLIGLRHADCIRQIDGVELCAIVDPAREAQDKAAELGVDWFADLREMINSERPDGLILSTPTPLHVKQGLECAEMSIPTLVEKPLADNLQGAEILVQAFEAANIPLLVGHHRRFNPIIQKAKAILTERKIGDLRAVHAKCWFYKPDTYFNEAPWRKLKGAGPISVNLVHEIDLLRYLCGEITHVQAQITPSVRGYENEDVAAAILRFANGAIGTVTVSDSIVAPWSWEFTSQENPVYPYVEETAYQIGGSEGSLSIPDLTIWKHQGKRDWWSPISAISETSDISDPLINQIRHFADVITGKTKPVVSGREGLRALAVIDAIQIAAETGQTIQLANQSGITELAEFKINSELTPKTKPTLTKSAL